jgi:outer membrane protein assembly factor BamB
MRSIFIILTLFLSSSVAMSLPLPGGGPPESDCHAEFATTRMKLNYPPFNPEEPMPRDQVRCFDGEAGCDLDGEVNGTCVFDIDICLRNDDPALEDCEPDDVIAASAFTGDSPLTGLSEALADLLPAESSDCTEGQMLPIVLENGAVEQVTVRVEATTAGDVTDVDTVTFACVPHGWPSHGYNYGNHRSNPRETFIDVENAGALGIKWRFDVATFDAGAGLKSITSTPAVGNGLVYATSWSGKIYALDQETGEVVWDYQSSADFLGIEGSPTLTADGRVIITVDKTLECLDARDGSLLWSTPLTEVPELEMWGAATVANGRVFVGIASAADSPCASEGQLVAVDLDTGEVLWRYLTTPAMVCRTDTAVECSEDEDCPRGGPCVVGRGAGITARPAVDPTGEIVFANTVGCFTFPSIGDSDSLLSFDAATGDVRWKNRVRPPEQFGYCPDDEAAECREDADCSEGTCRAKGAFHDFGFLNGPLYVGAAETGIGRGLVVSGSKDGSLYAVDPDTGEPVWTNEVVPVPVSPGLAAWGLFNGAIAYGAGHVYAGLHDVAPSVDPDHLQAFRITDGATAWARPFDRTWGDTSLANGVLFIGDCGDNTICKPACNDEDCLPGSYYVVDAADGRIVKRFSTPAAVAGGAAIVDGVVYAPYGLFGPAGGITAYAVACPGDCDLDGRTEVSELIRGVGESLGEDVLECGIFDRDGSGRILVSDLVLAVRASLEGCAAFGF